LDVMAIIPARAGSKGVPGKNIRILGGYPLIAYSIITAKLTEKITRVIVSTDSEEIAAISREYGAETPFLRPAELATDHSTDTEFMAHAIAWFRNYDGLIPDYLVHLRPTTPLRDPAVVDSAIAQLMKRSEATSLRSAHLAPESPRKWFQRDERGYFRSLLDNSDNEALNNPRQVFPDAYIPNGYVDVVIPSFISDFGMLYGERMMAFVSPFCVEVDTLNDYDWLEYDLHKNGSVLWDYLKENHPKRGLT
jgi:CMP-N,N'-diacetyllegionaminic acid synthase